MTLKWSHEAKIWLIYWISLRGASYLAPAKLSNIEKLSEDKTSSSEDDNPPEDEESVEYEEYLEKFNKKLFDLFH